MAEVPESPGGTPEASLARRWVRRAGAYALWTVTLVMCLTMVEKGWDKYASWDGWSYWFAQWGYGAWFAAVVGVVEGMGGLLLLVPALAAYAATALLVVMAGALYTVTTHETDLSWVDPVVFGALLAVVLAGRWTRRWKPRPRQIHGTRPRDDRVARRP